MMAHLWWCLYHLLSPHQLKKKVIKFGVPLPIFLDPLMGKFLFKKIIGGSP